jgi:hypothetical protein
MGDRSVTVTAPDFQASEESLKSREKVGTQSLEELPASREPLSHSKSNANTALSLKLPPAPKAKSQRPAPPPPITQLLPKPAVVSERASAETPELPSTPAGRPAPPPPIVPIRTVRNNSSSISSNSSGRENRVDSAEPDPTDEEATLSQLALELIRSSTSVVHRGNHTSSSSTNPFDHVDQNPFLDVPETETSSAADNGSSPAVGSAPSEPAADSDLPVGGTAWEREEPPTLRGHGPGSNIYIYVCIFQSVSTCNSDRHRYIERQTDS